MQKTILGVKHQSFFCWAVIFLSSLVLCGAALPTVNAVQSISITDMNQILSAKSFNGVVEIMASWCPPCREELPDLAKLYRKYHHRGIEIVAVSIDADCVDAVQPLINKLQIPFPVYCVGANAVKHYKVVGIPTLMVVSNGTILEKLPGRHQRRFLEGKIKKLIELRNGPNIRP